MNKNLQEALIRCLARLESGAGLDECLRGEPLAADLRPILQAAASVRAERGRIPPHSRQQMERGRARMHAERAHQAGNAGSSFWSRLVPRAPALLAASAAAVILIALAFTTDLFDFGAEPTSAHVEGVVSSVQTDSLVLTTDDGLLSIRIGDGTMVVDSQGNVISGSDLVPGRSVRVEVEDEDGNLSGLRIDIDDEDDLHEGTEVEFSGTVAAVNGDTLTVDVPFGQALVQTTAQTEIKGILSEGTAIEVHATVQPDGTYVAREIEVEGAEDEDDDDQHDADHDGDDDGHDADDDSDDADHDSGDDDSRDSDSGSSGDEADDSGPFDDSNSGSSGSNSGTSIDESDDDHAPSSRDSGPGFPDSDSGSSDDEVDDD